MVNLTLGICGDSSLSWFELSCGKDRLAGHHTIARSPACPRHSYCCVFNILGHTTSPPPLLCILLHHRGKWISEPQMRTSALFGILIWGPKRATLSLFTCPRFPLFALSRFRSFSSSENTRAILPYTGPLYFRSDAFILFGSFALDIFK